MNPLGFFVLLDPGRGFWTGHGWTVDLQEAKRFAGSREPYARARKAADCLFKRRRGAPIVAYVPPAEVYRGETPQGLNIHPPRGKD